MQVIIMDKQWSVGVTALVPPSVRCVDGISRSRIQSCTVQRGVNLLEILVEIGQRDTTGGECFHHRIDDVLESTFTADVGLEFDSQQENTFVYGNSSERLTQIALDRVVTRRLVNLWDIHKDKVKFAVTRLGNTATGDSAGGHSCKFVERVHERFGSSKSVVGRCRVNNGC